MDSFTLQYMTTIIDLDIFDVQIGLKDKLNEAMESDTLQVELAKFHVSIATLELNARCYDTL